MAILRWGFALCDGSTCGRIVSAHACCAMCTHGGVWSKAIIFPRTVYSISLCYGVFTFFNSVTRRNSKCALNIMDTLFQTVSKPTPLAVYSYQTLLLTFSFVFDSSSALTLGPHVAAIHKKTKDNLIINLPSPLALIFNIPLLAGGCCGGVSGLLGVEFPLSGLFHFTRFCFVGVAPQLNAILCVSMNSSLNTASSSVCASGG